MTPVRFLKIAQAELDDAALYYDLEHPGLGKRFRGEVQRAISRIAEYPKAWGVERGEVRKCLLHTFPYKLLYSIESSHILVLAVAHQHRRPDYWVDRLSRD